MNIFTVIELIVAAFTTISFLTALFIIELSITFIYVNCVNFNKIKSTLILIKSY